MSQPRNFAPRSSTGPRVALDPLHMGNELGLLGSQGSSKPRPDPVGQKGDAARNVTKPRSGARHQQFQRPPFACHICSGCAADAVAGAGPMANAGISLK